MATAHFKGVLQAGRGGGAYVEIPGNALVALGGGSRFRVRGRLNGIEFSSSTMSLGDGRVCLGVHKATRERAGVGPGEEVRLEVDREERPRDVAVPDALRDALTQDSLAADAFERLAPTYRREYGEWVAGAKRAESRDRRLRKAIEMLRAGIKHP